LGLLDVVTEHPGPHARRLIGNVVIHEADTGRMIVGFENHGGRTRLRSGARPLGRVTAGFGNNGEDHTEGAVWKAVYGTYLHGPLLPKNAWFADLLIETALRRRYGTVALAPLPDVEERRAALAAAARSGAPRTASH
jgi:CobQ-like glutamine amidotransferase family enzyme